MLTDVLCPKCSKFIGHKIDYAEYSSTDDVYESEAISKQLNSKIFDSNTLEVIAEVIGLESQVEIK